MLGLGDQKDPFLKAFRQGKLEDVSISPTSEIITDGNTEIITDGNNEYAKVRVTVPSYSLSKSGIRNIDVFKRNIYHK